MLAAVYLAAAFLAGLALVQKFAPSFPALVRLPGALVGGILLTAWVTYVGALALSPLTDDSLLYGMLISLALNGAVVAYLRRELTPSAIRMHPLEIAFVGLSLLFSFWLMDNRLFYDRDAPGDPLVVSAETWGDTALHVALSKSFSAGTNYPTEYPFYGDEPIRYHFGYDFFAGALQEGGMSVGNSFNLPGALGFAAMMMLLFSVGRMLFYPGETYPGETPGGRPWLRQKGVWVGLIAVAVLLTNQSMEFFRWFDPSPNTRRADLDYSFVEALKPDNWWHHQGYLSIGPYYPDKIAIFNTLNVYLTQTHLIIAMALVLFVAFGLLVALRRGEDLQPRSMAFLGLLFGLSFWFNGVLYIAAGVFFGALLVIFASLAAFRHAQPLATDLRSTEFLREFGRWSRMAAWFIVPALALAIPQAVWLNGGLDNNGSFDTHVGYLVCSSPNSNCYANGEMDLLNISHWGEFVNYWLLNEGLVFPILVVAIFIGSRSDWKILASVMSVFVFGSLFQLSRDLGGHNHKVFNLWETLAAPFIGYVLVEVWNIGRRKLGRIDIPSATALALRPFAAVAVPVAFFFLVVSGLLDFMTIKNDFEVAVFGERQSTIEWIEKNTPGDAMFLVVYDDLYSAPTLAGRRVFLGYRPWAGSAGYDVPAREVVETQIYGAQSKETACRLLRDNSIDYVVIGPGERNNNGKFTLNEGLFSAGFTQAGAVQEPGGLVAFYDVKKSCPPAVAASP